MAFVDLFDHDAERLRGIERWEDLVELGASNLDRLIELLRDRANAALAEQRFDDARDRGAFIAELTALRDRVTEHKPMLPRMRVELFRIGAPVVLWLGDSPSALVTGWAHATVTKLAKSFRPEWKTARGNSGYFWEVTATADRELFEGTGDVRFSTTEPRVLPAPDLVALRARDRFRDIFVQNAWRDWNPLWCIDRGVSVDATHIDFATWLP